MPAPVAVQVTLLIPVVTGPASVSIGVFRVNWAASALQPAMGSTSASAIGWSVGNCTTTLVVVWGSFSFGTTNASTASLPFGAVSGSILTWAQAGAATATSATPAAARTIAIRRTRFPLDDQSLCRYVV